MPVAAGTYVCGYEDCASRLIRRLSARPNGPGSSSSTMPTATLSRSPRSARVPPRRNRVRPARRPLHQADLVQGPEGVPRPSRGAQRRDCGGGRYTARPAVTSSVKGVEHDAGVDHWGCEQGGGGHGGQQPGDQQANSSCHLRLLSGTATCRPTGVRRHHAAGMTGEPGYGSGRDAARPMFLRVSGSVGRDHGKAGDQGRCCERGGDGHHGQQPNAQQAKSACHLRLLSGTAMCLPTGSSEPRLDGDAEP
jgi:hypothetical protein